MAKTIAFVTDTIKEQRKLSIISSTATIVDNAKRVPVNKKISEYENLLLESITVLEDRVKEFLKLKSRPDVITVSGEDLEIETKSFKPETVKKIKAAEKVLEEFNKTLTLIITTPEEVKDLEIWDKLTQQLSSVKKLQISSPKEPEQS